MEIGDDPRWQTRLTTQQPQDGIREVVTDKLILDAHTFTLDFHYYAKKLAVGEGGTYVLRVDGKKIGESEIFRTVPFLYSIDETLDVGEDRGTPILEDNSERISFPYNGRIESVTLDLKPATQNRIDEKHESTNQVTLPWLSTAAPVIWIPPITDKKRSSNLTHFAVLKHEN